MTKGQTVASQNGVYDVVTIGSGSDNLVNNLATLFHLQQTIM